MTPQPPGTPVRTDAELFDFWQSLMGSGGFGVRSLWLIFLDAEDRTSHVVVPIDDLPACPDPAFVHNLAKVLDGILGLPDVARAALLLSRPGTDRMGEGDRAWARALHAELGARCRWPMYLATLDRLQAFAPDDLAA